MATARVEKRTVENPVMQAVEEEVVVVEMRPQEARDLEYALLQIDGPGDSATKAVWKALRGISLFMDPSFTVIKAMQTETR